MTAFSSFFLILFFSSTAIAHNVVGGVYVNGFDIEGEVGFSNGAMAKKGTIVKVFDVTGASLGEVLTDEQGFFIFTAKQHITHVFDINLGAGHRLKMHLPAQELPDSLDSLVKVNTNQSFQITKIETPQDATPITLLMLEKALAKQIKPLRKEIQALKIKSGLRDIIGGIGYIFGLLALLAFLRDHQKKAKK